MSLRIGILGAARVATYAMIGAAKDVEGVNVAGVAARDPERAKNYAKTHEIPRVFSDYEALIASPEIDAVYNALPPNLHAKWSIAALEAGKPVLCEKPFALSVADARAMLDAEARTGRLLMEAQHSHYHPVNARVRELVTTGQIGRVRHAIACFNVDIERTSTEIRWLRDVGGGAIWDLGIYPLWWLMAALGETPIVRSATQQRAEGGADIVTCAALDFPSGATAEITTDMIGPRTAWMRIEGDAGSLFVENPLSATYPQIVRLERDGAQSEETFTRRKSFAFQLEAFRDAILHGAEVPTRGAASIAIIALCEEICAIATVKD